MKVKLNRLRNLLLLALMGYLFFGCNSQAKLVNVETVENFEVQRFLGQWHEIARYPHSFEKDLVGVTANYSMREDGLIKVVNKGFKKSLQGPVKEAVGKAKIPDSSIPSKLKVSFFWIFYADYFVLELDQKNYQWAVIGSSSPKYLWILSRTPQMDEDQYKKLLELIQLRGYDLGKLERVLQPQ